ncbi:MAG: DUF4236 domain-containing protein [Salinivirgaceae bacterium]|nr:DUF4236 domain-containing protein [Salinivirgaceae bacterium]
MAGWNFRKRKNILPGVTLNFSKKGVSTTIGPKGFRLSFGQNGTYLNTSIPGTGIYKRQKISGNQTSNNNSTNGGCLRTIIWLVLIFSLLVCTSGIVLLNDSKANVETSIEADNETKTEAKKESKTEDIMLIVIFSSISIICIVSLIKIKSKSANNLKKTSYNYDYTQLNSHTDKSIDTTVTSNTEYDPLFEEAARIVVITQQGSSSLIQRKFSIGYSRAGHIIDQLEKAGIVGPFNKESARQVLIPDEQTLNNLLKTLTKQL